MQANILAAYGLRADECDIHPFGSGLINATWKVTCKEQSFILQRINHLVFKEPVKIAQNIDTLGIYLDQHHPSYFFVKPVQTIDRRSMVVTDNGEYFRLQPFVEDAHSYDVVDNEQLAYEAAKQFGRFTRLLSGVNCEKVAITLPDFHNLSLRYAQFEQAIREGNAERIAAAMDTILALRKYAYLVDVFISIQQDPAFKIRVTHHDTKISNVLFNSRDKGICVIDLDTVMPGYFISDFGDMMRTYLSPVSEEEKDFNKIIVRTSYYRAIVEGYLSEMADELSNEEKQHLVYAGQFMVYMQAIRFLTDHLNNDVYYGAKYDQHNLVRACNQLTLLNAITDQATTLSTVVVK
jgi:Ser/Thr protein kinase RdoA (MazF antagonist)